jgi:predicted transcriptional regulator
MATPAEGFTEPVSFRDARSVVQKVDRLAQSRGTDRSALYREAMRYFLDNLSEREKKLFIK